MAIAFAVVIALIAGAIGWVMLPSAPRDTLAGTYDEVVFAPDGTSFVTVQDGRFRTPGSGIK